MGAAHASRIVMLGPAYGPRRESFEEACSCAFGAPPHVLSWAEFCASPDRLADALGAGAYLRFDSPDQDFESLSALYARGEEAAIEAGVDILPVRDHARLRSGELGSPTQFWFGICAAVAEAFEMAKRRGAPCSVAPGDCASAFDKTQCSRRLRAAGVATPRMLPEPRNFDDLIAAMDASSLSRIFVKLRHGSAAAGMIALARGGDRWRAITTATTGADGRIYASRAVRLLTDWREIKSLIDRLARLGLHAEAWLPKIGIDGRISDLRLVIVGDLIFPVLRGSRHPMTNLHLGGSRSAPDALIAKIGGAAWLDVLQTARAVSREFASADTLGVDVAVLAGGRRHAVLEVNVFGDFVKDVELNGLSPHQAQANGIAQRLLSPCKEACGAIG